MSKTIIIFTVYINNEFKFSSYIYSHARQYVKMGYNVVVFAQKHTIPIAHFFSKDKEYNIDGINVIVGNRLSVSRLFPNSKINFNGLFYYLSVKSNVRKLIKSNNVILFDAHTFHSEGYAAFLLKKKYPNVKATVTFHGSCLEATMVSEVEKKRVIKAAKYIDMFVCVSDKLTKKLKSLNIENVKTIYNGINMFKIHNYKKEKTIISCGNLVASKSFDLLISAFNIFHKKNPEYKLKIIGSGYLKNDLIKLINDCNLNNSVELLGQLPNDQVYIEYEKSMIFMLVSKPEGFGIVYPEAMYCGCVTIGTKHEGIDGFIKNNENGFLVNQNIDEMVDILNYIVSHDCSSIVKKGIADSKKLTWGKNCQEYLKSANCLK